MAHSNKRYKFNNNFDFLRIFAALLVVFSHSYALTGYGSNEPFYILNGITTLGRMGVVIFFVVSGYLITKSWQNHPSSSQFFWNRFLRIVPGLVGVTLFSVFFIGPLVTNLSIFDYFQNMLTWKYLTNIFVFNINYNLPGVFVNNPYPNAVNGSIWTLPVEFGMYILIFIIGFFGRLNKRSLVVLLFLFATLIFLKGVSPVNYTLLFSLFFVIGAIYQLQKGIIFNLKVSLLLFILWIASFQTPFFMLTSIICLPYIILYIGNKSSYPFNKISKYGDFSYGLYIYAFPVQQTIAYFIHGISAIAMFMLSLLLIFPLAILSWKLIESKALGYKKVDISSVSKNYYNIFISKAKFLRFYIKSLRE